MDITESLQARIHAARTQHTSLRIRAGGSKDFYGHALQGEVLDVSAHAGIISYEPTELVVTVRCGTSLATLEATLKEQGQCLPFEPPHFSADDIAGGAEGGTVGGMVAAGLAGPARAAVGGVRDYVLGATLLNGQGEVLHFGGTVMKNVAGYDVARLLAGSLGTLGIILDVSLKVLPLAPAQATVCFDMTQTQALHKLNQWGGQPLPINASCWHAERLHLRLSGARAAVQTACSQFQTQGGMLLDETAAQQFWQALRNQRATASFDEALPKSTRACFFGMTDPNSTDGAHDLWRLSLPQTAPALDLTALGLTKWGVTDQHQLIEWGGAQRWLKVPAHSTLVAADLLRQAAQSAGGHATLFRAANQSNGVARPNAFTPLPAATLRIHQALKQQFDAPGIFNRGRLYPEF